MLALEASLCKVLVERRKDPSRFSNFENISMAVSSSKDSDQSSVTGRTPIQREVLNGFPCRCLELIAPSTTYGTVESHAIRVAIFAASLVTRLCSLP